MTNNSQRPVVVRKGEEEHFEEDLNNPHAQEEKIEPEAAQHTSTTQTTSSTDSLTRLTHVIYALYALSFFVGFSSIVAIILNYIKLNAVKGTWLATHFRWQIRTFWFGILWLAIGSLTINWGIGLIVLMATGIWYIYRIVKGWLRLNDGRTMYTEPTT